MLYQRNSEPVQLSLVAHSTLHQHLGSVVCDQRQHDLEPRADPMNSVLISKLHARHSLSFEDQPCDRCRSEDSQVWPVHVKKSIGAEDRKPLPVAHSEFNERAAARAFHHAAIDAVEGGNPHGARPFKHRRNERAIANSRVDIEQASGAATIWIRRALPIFDPAVDVQHWAVAPGWVTRLAREVVPVPLLPPSPGHCVYAGSTSQHLARGERIDAPVQIWVWAGLEIPIPLGFDIAGPLTTIGNAWQSVMAPSLEQEHAQIRVLGQPACHH